MGRVRSDGVGITLGGSMSDCDNVDLDAVGRSEVRIDELSNLEIFLALGRLPRYGSAGY